jgi:hypothetical protein
VYLPLLSVFHAVLMQARGFSSVMARGWARAARLRALFWTTLLVAAAVPCGCPQVGDVMQTSFSSVASGLALTLAGTDAVVCPRL